MQRVLTSMANLVIRFAIDLFYNLSINFKEFKMLLFSKPAQEIRQLSLNPMIFYFIKKRDLRASFKFINKSI